MTTTLTDDERDLIAAWVAAKRPDRINAIRSLDTDAYDPHSYEAAGTMHIGRSLEEQRRGAQASMRVVAAGIVIGLIVTACVIVALMPRTLGLFSGEPTAQRALWYPAGECLEHATTGELACPVVTGGE